MTSIHWRALQIWPNHEATITQHLHLLGVESYYPARQNQSRWARHNPGRYKPVPLFPGYLFARFEYSERVSVLRLPWVKLVGDETAVIPAVEIESIRQLVNSKLGLFTHYSLEPGRKVRIACGPLTGIEGVVVEHKGQERILVSVELISRALSVELD